MLARISLTHFKCFQQLDLPCAPLTLLCGLNGMGKSSVIQALLVLRQSFETGDLLEGRLVLGGALTDLGAGSDVLFEDADEDVIRFVLHGERPSSRSDRRTACPVTGEPAKGAFASVDAEAKARSILNQMLSGHMGDTDLRAQVANPRAFRSAIARARKRRVQRIRQPSRYLDAVVEASWAGAFRYSKTGDQLTAVEGMTGVNDPRRTWRDLPPFGGRLVYVQAERIGPRKSYPLSEVSARRGDLRPSGEFAWNYLNERQDTLLDADDPRCEGNPGHRLIDIVDHWLQDVSPGAHLELESVAAADAVIAGFSFDRPSDVRSQRHRATNVGFGLSYVLPVVIGLLAEPGALCLIENPEAHLHPRGQTRLAELAARAAAAGVQVFAETHSDHFLDGVRLAARNGVIAPDDVAIHYFERDGGRAVVSSPTLDADGRLSGWPSGFFDQHDENLARLLAPRD